jgi:hypothetical protein
VVNAVMWTAGAAVVAAVSLAASGCAPTDVSSAPRSSERPASTPASPSITSTGTPASDARRFADPMALARTVGCADTFSDERPGGHEGVDHAECIINGQVLTLYVFDDAAAKENWIRKISGFESEQAMEETGGVLIEGTWALGSYDDALLKQLVKRVSRPLN